MDLAQARAIFSKLSVMQICDVTENVRVVDSAIRPFIPNPKMLGKALTVKAEGDLLPVLKALELATDENVIVIQADSAYAMAGDIFASEAIRKKIAGIVIDGLCRDAEAVAKVGLPFYARGICPKASPKKKIGEFNVPVVCGGVTILPGDIILGDEHGVVAVKLEELQTLLSQAAEILEREERVLEKIRSGTSLLELVNFSEHYEKIKKGEASTFKWK